MAEKDKQISIDKTLARIKELKNKRSISYLTKTQITYILGVVGSIIALTTGGLGIASWAVIAGVVGGLTSVGYGAYQFWLSKDLKNSKKTLAKLEAQKQLLETKNTVQDDDLEENIEQVRKLVEEERLARKKAGNTVISIIIGLTTTALAEVVKFLGKAVSGIFAIFTIAGSVAELYRSRGLKEYKIKQKKYEKELEQAEEELKEIKLLSLNLDKNLLELSQIYSKRFAALQTLTENEEKIDNPTKKQTELHEINKNLLNEMKDLHFGNELGIKQLTRENAERFIKIETISRESNIRNVELDIVENKKIISTKTTQKTTGAVGLALVATGLASTVLGVFTGLIGPAILGIALGLTKIVALAIKGHKEKKKFEKEEESQYEQNEAKKAAANAFKRLKDLKSSLARKAPRVDNHKPSSSENSEIQQKNDLTTKGVNR